MAASRLFLGPVVLLGPSLSRQDEPAFLRVVDRLGGVLGKLPSTAMLKMIPMAARHARVSPDRRAELVADLQNNDPAVMRQIFRGYLSYLDATTHRRSDCATRGVPAWIVHADKGDGGLTDQERNTLEACAHTKTITIPGTSYFIPNEEPERVAACITEALGPRTDRTSLWWTARYLRRIVTLWILPLGNSSVGAR